MILSWLEQALTYKPDKVLYAPIDRYNFRKKTLLHSSGETTTLYLADRECDTFVLFSHGNTGNVSFHSWFYDFFERLGVAFAAYDYPGYGESLGVPSETLLYESGEKVLQFLLNDSSINQKKIFHFGLSLGAAVSVHLAQKFPCKGLILEAPFTDTRSMAARKVPIPGITMIVKNRYDNLSKITHCATPTLIIHGSNDLTSPVEMAKEIFDAHPGQKELFVVEGAGHRDIGQIGADEYYSRIKSFIHKFE